MAKGNGQRLKALYILKILQENSDEKHLLKTQQIIDRLEGYGIPAERKSVYADISALKELGYEIVCVRARANGGYYLKNRSFELPELKLLTDAVQASRLITVKKSRQLISKLETLASPFEAKQLNRQVYVSDRNKTDNETIYETIDRLHESMQKNRQVRFQYLEWTADGKKKCRHSGAFYEVSPYFLIWRDENYYLVAYDAKAQIMKHYRVDRYRHYLFQSMTGKEQRWQPRSIRLFIRKRNSVCLQETRKLLRCVMTSRSQVFFLTGLVRLSVSESWQTATIPCVSGYHCPSSFMDG